MKQLSPFPVTRDNINTCWIYMDTLRRKSRLMAAIAGIGGFFSHLALLFALIVAANVLIWLHFEGSYPAFLGVIPGFSTLMELLSMYILDSGDSMQIQALKLMGLVYGAAILIFLLLALVIRLLYHSLKRQLPEGTYSEQTAALATAAREGRTYSCKTRLSPSMVCIILAIVSVVVLFLAYVAYLGDAEKMISILSIFPTQDPYTNCTLYALALYIPFGIFSWLMLVLTRWIYRYDFPYNLLAQAEAAAIFALDETEDLPEEEIAARRKADAEKLREEALELELEHAYVRAKALLLKAALCGDVPAMEHYARLCLLDHMNDSARYWLERCVESGEGSKAAMSMLKRMKLRLPHNVRYRHPAEAPLTKGKQIFRKIRLILEILFKAFMALLFVVSAAAYYILYKNHFDVSVFQNLSETIRTLFS